jgi:hypothetical protein
MRAFGAADSVPNIVGGQAGYHSDDQAGRQVKRSRRHERACGQQNGKRGNRNPDLLKENARENTNVTKAPPSMGRCIHWTRVETPFETSIMLLLCIPYATSAQMDDFLAMYLFLR